MTQKITSAALASSPRKTWKIHLFNVDNSNDAFADADVEEDDDGDADAGEDADADVGEDGDDDAEEDGDDGGERSNQEQAH